MTPVTQLWIAGEITLVNVPTEMVQELYQHLHFCKWCSKRTQYEGTFQPSRWCPTGELLIELQLQAGDANAPSGR